MFGNSVRTVSMASGTSINIAAEGGSCKAEFISGYMTVPNVVALGIQKVSDSAVNYSYSYSNCAAGDKIKVTVQSPAPAATKTTTTILVQ